MAIHLPADGRMRALSIREPFATLVAKGFKPIENKSTKYPSTLPTPCTFAIHATCDASTHGDDCADVCEDPLVNASFNNEDYVAHKYGSEWFYGGCIVGLVDVIGCVCIADMNDAELSEAIDAKYPWVDGVQKPGSLRSEWANGPYCLILDNPRRFKTGVVCLGRQGWWILSPEKQSLVIEASKSFLLNPNDLPTAPVDGRAKMLGRIAS